MAETINFLGTGGIIEGNLGAANVNVNLDSSLYFDGTNDKIDAGNIGSHAQYTVSAWIKVDASAVGAENSIWDANGASNSGHPHLSIGYGSSPEQLLLYYAAGNNNCNLPTNADITKWNHTAVTYDTTGTNTVKAYWNGVEIDSDAVTSDVDFTDFWIGNGHYGGFVGYIADVKTFNDNLGIDDIKILASKINVDPSLVSATANLTGWWKLNEGTGTTINDFVNETNGGTDHNGTLTEGTWKFDQYYVDVYDNSTTTDGNFEISQGKVEGKALTSLHFHSDNDRVDVADFDLYNSATEGSFSIWVNPDTVSGNQYIATKYDTTGGGNREFQLYLSSANAKWNVQDDKSNHDANHAATGSSSLVADKWYHLCGTFSTTNGQKIYVNGVLDGTATTAITDAINDTTSNLMFGANQSSSPTTFFNGRMRDAKSFGHELSAEQVASLYSGSYNVTPEHWWKLDDSIQGTAITTAEDSGTGTAADGSLQNFGGTDGTYAGSGWNNGTLNLDGTLTISEFGTLSAPRGDLDLAGNFTMSHDTSTYTHNSGTFKPSANCELLPYDWDSSENARHIFHDVAHTGGTLYMHRPVEIHGTYTKTGGEVRQYAKCTFGTATASGNMTINNTQWRMWGHYGNPYLYAANQLFPVNIGGSVSDPIEWDAIDQRASARDTVTHIKWINYGNTEGTQATKNTVTGGGGARIQLDGDCEFDALTVTANDTLDVDGQRIHTTGNVDINGDLKMGAGMWHAGANFDTSNAAVTEEAGATFLLEGDNYIHNNDGSFVGDANTNILLQGTKTTYLNSSDANVSTYVGNLIAGSGTATLGGPDRSGYKSKANNLTVATGGTLAATGAHEITCLGDFTTSGGLIGKSAYDFNGAASGGGFVNCGSHADIGNIFDSGGTVEAWIRIDGDAGTASGMRPFSKNQWFISVDNDASGDVYKLRLYYNFSGDNGVWSSTSTVLSQDKWHHIAITYDNGNVANTPTMYVDGKQVAVTTTTPPTSSRDTDASSPLYLGNRADGARTFNGPIAMARIWSDIRTESELRTNMFDDFASMTTPEKVGMLGMWQFDEGTGVDVDNLGSVAANADGTITANSSAWAGTGTFDEGSDSTLVMTGTDARWYMGSYLGVGSQLANFTVNGTVTLQSVGYGYGAVYFTSGSSTFTLGASGTLSSHDEETLYFANAGNTINVSANTDGLANLFKIRFRHSSGNINLPEMTTKFVHCETSGGTVTATGNLTLTSELEVDSGTTFNANGNTINGYTVDVDGGTLDLRNSSLLFNVSSANDSLDFTSASTLLTGNTTITGYDTPSNKHTWSGFTGGGFEVVGDVSNLNIAVGELTVIGSVSNCTGVGIKQWHHTLDTQQLLDADEAGDDDLRLTKPALDNALELMTK